MVSYVPTGSETEPDHALEDQHDARTCQIQQLQKIMQQLEQDLQEQAQNYRPTNSESLQAFRDSQIVRMCQIQQMQKRLQQLQQPQQQTQTYSQPCPHAVQAWRNDPSEGAVVSLALISSDTRATQDMHMRRTYELLHMQRLQQQQQQLSQEQPQTVSQSFQHTAPTWPDAHPFSSMQEPTTTSSNAAGNSRQPNHDVQNEATREILPKQQMNPLPRQQQHQAATQSPPQPEPFIPTQQDTPPHTPPHSNSHPNLYLLCPNERCKHENWYHQEGTESCCAYVTASPHPTTSSADHKQKARDCDGDEEMFCDGDCDAACDEDGSGNGGREEEIMVCCQCGAAMEAIFLSDSEDDDDDDDDDGDEIEWSGSPVFS